MEYAPSLENYVFGYSDNGLWQEGVNSFNGFDGTFDVAKQPMTLEEIKEYFDWSFREFSELLIEIGWDIDLLLEQSVNPAILNRIHEEHIRHFNEYFADDC